MPSPPCSAGADVPDLAAALALLAAELGAVPLGQCPGCGEPTEYSSTGHVSYYHACTVQDLDEDPVREAQRRQLGLSRDNYARWRADHESRAARTRFYVDNLYA